MQLDVVDLLRKVAYADNGIRELIYNDDFIRWFGRFQACSLCTSYLVQCDKRDADCMDTERERRRGACLLILMAALRLGTEESVREALCLLGARGVGTRGLSRAERLRKAGEASRRSLKSERHYERYGYANEMIRRLADELYDLITHVDLLECALLENGEMAVAKYL